MSMNASFVSTTELDAARAERDATRNIVLEERRVEYEDRKDREERIAKRKARTGEVRRDCPVAARGILQPILAACWHCPLEANHGVL